MNYGQIKENLISLGFADENDYAEYEQLGYTINAINRAIRAIEKEFPYYSSYEEEITDGIVSINMADETDDFLGFAKRPVTFIENDNGSVTVKVVQNFELDEDGLTIIIDGSKRDGRYKIKYMAKCSDIDENTSDNFVTELPLKTHHLIPLLAAYYLWLDDDAAKAAQYYNMYETELSTLLQKSNEPRMRVRTDWRGLCL